MHLIAMRDGQTCVLSEQENNPFENHKQSW